MMSLVQPGMGRLHAPDPKDARFPARAVMAADVPLRDVLYSCRVVLNQGDTGTCVGHGWKDLLLSAPVMQGLATSDPTAFAIYCAALGMDEWTENDGDCAKGDYNFGTSVRAGAKALQGMGLIGEYRWAPDAPTALQWLMQHGPVVIGSEWRMSMFTPDRKGYLVVDRASEVAGGHCYLLLGYSRLHGAVRMLNSWGRGWGQRGRCWIRVDDLDYLIKADGEACMTNDIRLKVA